MERKNNSQEEITKMIDSAMEKVFSFFDTEQYKKYLSTMSKFHDYSFNNTLLIMMQKPEATFVAGYNSWQKNFERHVNPGEKGIKILAPAPYKKKKEVDVIDPITHRPVMNEKGQPIKETVEITIPTFHAVTVFDVSQTSGKELPMLGVDELKFDVENYKDFMKALEKISPVPLSFEKIETGAKGFFSPAEQKIVINQGMSESQTVKTAIHEICHSLLDDKDHVRLDGIENAEKRTRSDKEVTAESVAYTVSSAFDIDTSDYSFGYIAGWSSGKNMTELKESMETIKKTASHLINSISQELEILAKEHEKEMPVYEIWQLKNEPEYRDYLFTGTEELQTRGLEIDRHHYEMIYTGHLAEKESLENLYVKFNTDHPEDFRGHSMSVSDVVVIRSREEAKAHYVDSYGFTEVPQFLVDKQVEVTRDEHNRDVIAGPITLTVAECCEIHSLGEYHENITSGKEAIAILEGIPEKRIPGPKSIGMDVPMTNGEHMEIDLVVGKYIDLDMLKYVEGITENDKAMELVAELVHGLPDKEIHGQIPERLQEKLVQMKETNPIAHLEELEEENGNMIDGIKNNGYGEKTVKEENKKNVRESLRRKLEEKKVLVASMPENPAHKDRNRERSKT